MWGGAGRRVCVCARARARARVCVWRGGETRRCPDGAEASRARAHTHTHDALTEREQVSLNAETQDQSRNYHTYNFGPREKRERESFCLVLLLCHSVSCYCPSDSLCLSVTALHFTSLYISSSHPLSHPNPLSFLPPSLFPSLDMSLSPLARTFLLSLPPSSLILTLSLVPSLLHSYLPCSCLLNIDTWRPPFLPPSPVASRLPTSQACVST